MTVNYWQSITDKEEQNISVTPTVLLPDGSLSNSTSVVLNNIFAVILDQEAVGCGLFDQWSSPTPFNARGGYTNIFWHETCRYWNDFTEKGLVFVIDNPTP